MTKAKKRIRCEKHAHKWTVWEQGGSIIHNGIIPGTLCICGEKILIEHICPTCLHRKVVSVGAKSKEAKDYMEGKTI